MSFNKLKWIFGTSLVFLLFLATNLMDLSQFRDIKETTVNIYEDRLLSKNHLFTISELVQEKAVANALHDSAYYRLRDGNVNVELDEALSNYEGAKLTSKEKDNLALLRDAIEDLRAAESQFLQVNAPGADQEAHDRNANTIEREFENIHRRLNALAEIQVVEGRRQMVSARESVATVEILMKIEIIMLIVIFIGIQILVLYPSRKKKD